VIPVAVIGVGSMGRNHARVYRELLDGELVGVCDRDAGTAAAVGKFHGVPAFTDHLELLRRATPAAVTVAVPIHEHRRVAEDCLRAGCHVLVEKPIAATVAEAQALIDVAREVDRLLAVGHIERYNPAVIELKRRLDAGQLGRVFQMHARRLGPFPARVRDVGVVVDLATHDLDIMRWLCGRDAVRVYAETRREIHTDNEDMLTGLVRFADGSQGVLEINWLTPTKVRELTVTGERGMFRADYLTQDLYFYENADCSLEGWTAMDVLRGVSEGAMTRYALQRKEPLRAELEAFLAAITEEDDQIVKGVDGLRSLDLALALTRAADHGRLIELSG
jgi:UDP-N-acetylglucosamine 3-dehydrogenase